MALLTTHSATNKVVNSRPVVQYESTPTYYTYSDGTRKPIYWSITRSSSWSFSYVGMTQDAAESCAASVRSEYFLPYLCWEATVDTTTQDNPKVEIDSFTENRCSANIQPNHDAGDAWRVDVTVEETDVVISAKELKTLEEIEAYFQEATDRKIVTGRFRILDAHWSTAFNGIIECTIFQDISNFDPTNVTAKRLVNGQWLPLTVSGGSAKSITVQSQYNETIKLFYGDIETNQWTTRDSEPPELTLESVETDLGTSQPQLPGSTFIEMHTFYAVATIKNWVQTASALKIKWAQTSMPCTEITPQGGFRYRLKFHATKNIGRDILFENYSFSLEYNSGNSFGLSNSIPFSSFRSISAKIGLVESIGWYIASGETAKTWRLKVHVNTGIDFTAYGVTHNICTIKPDNTITTYGATFTADPDTRFDYATVVDVKEANSVFNTGIFLHYKILQTNKYSDSAAIPTDGGPITP